MMGDIEVMGDGGLKYLRDTAALGARCVVGATTNARCMDFAYCERLGQDPKEVKKEHELIAFYRKMNVVTTDTCINYQTVYQPHLGEHIAWGDTATGVISKIGHPLEGTSIRDKVLIIPTAKDGVAAGWAFFDIRNKGFAPKAFVFGKTNPVMVQGAVFAKLTITEGWSPTALEMFRTGDFVRVDPKRKTIERLKRSAT